MVLFGVWAGPSKPDMHAFLSMFVERMSAFYIEFQKKRYRILARCCVFGLPGKASVLNMNQFNGK